MKKIVYSFALAISVVMLFSACQDKDVYNPEYVRQLKSQLPDFDMRSAIKANIEYGRSAGNAGISIYTSNPIVPVLSNNGEFLYNTIVGEPIFSTFLDANGQFQGDIEIPNCENKVYIYSSDWGVPELVEAEVQNGQLNYTIYHEYGTRAEDGKRKVVADNELIETKLSDGYGTITSIVGGWNQYGRATDVNELESTGEYKQEYITAIQKTLWNGNTTKPGNLNNSKYITTTDVVNTSIATVYQDADGTIHTVEDAEVFFTFISEAGWWSSSVGYYYYKIGEVPTPDQVEKFIIVPNVSIVGNNSQQSGSANPVLAGQQGMEVNKKIQLLFRDPETGKLTSKFPGGYTIGYFMIPDGYRNQTNDSTRWVLQRTDRVSVTTDLIVSNVKYAQKTCPDCNGTGKVSKKWIGISIKNDCSTCNKTGKVDDTTNRISATYSYENDKNTTEIVTTFYDANGNVVSNPDYNNMSQYYYDRNYYKLIGGTTSGITFNKNNWIYSNSDWNSNKKDKFIALTDKNTSEVVYSIEDGADTSYDDVMFTISCSPNAAIYNPSRPTITESGTTEKNITSTKHGYYLFEDIWSSGGDYDMNDVIVEYNYLENIKQYVTYKTTTNTGSGSTTTETTSEAYIDNVTITINPKHCGATYTDGFALQLPEYFTNLGNDIESVTVNGGANLWTDQKYFQKLNASNTDTEGRVIVRSNFAPRFTYEFFHDAKNEIEGKGYVMKITFKNKTVTQQTWETNKHVDASVNDKRLRWDYNPYLNVYDLSLLGFATNTGNSILEIHLPLYPYTEAGIPTAGGASSGTNSYDWNLWFVAAKNAGVGGSLTSATEFYPFAMDIPYDKEFYPSREMLRIDEAYPDFPTYNGKNSVDDWYKHRAKNKTQPFTLKRSNWIFWDYTDTNDYDR